MTAGALPVLIVTPHSSGFAPADVLGQMLGDAVLGDGVPGSGVLDLAAREARLAWLLREGDPLTDVLFHAPEARALHASVSRFVADLNRDRAEGGENGVVKLTDFEGNALYPPGFTLAPEEAEERLRRYWDPFHAEIEQVLGRQDVRLIVNGHSMQPRGPLIGPDQGRPRPALTLMTGGDARGESVDGRRTGVSPEQARELMALLEGHFGQILQAQSDVPPVIALNAPWSVDSLSFRLSDPTRARPVPGFGLEINRALYLDPPQGAAPRQARVPELNKAFRAFLREAAALFA